MMLAETAEKWGWRNEAIDLLWLAAKDSAKGDEALATLYRYFGLDLERPHIPHAEAWYQRLTARPAYREHVMVPFAELRGRLEF